MVSRRLLSLLLLTCVVAAGCKRKPVTPPDVIVRVGERMLTLSDFKRYLERNTGTDLAQMTPEVTSAMLDQFVEEIVLSEYAASHGVEIPAEKIAAAVRTEAGSTVIEKRDEMRRAKLIVDIATQMPDASDEEVRAYYQEHAAEFQAAEQVRVRQILVRDETVANEIVAKLRQGVPFGDLSSEFSRAPNAKRGGEIGFVSRGELPKMFEEQIFRLQPGQVSDVIRTDSSFHIFQVDERRAAGTISIEAAAPAIRTRLKEDALRERLAQLVAASRREMQIAVLTRRVPFRYSGSFPTSADE
ncbi:MAG TPA: peptidyl-prolyl cis-trans isomerase [Thermoanaerobaculia bacterium]|jgi:parvulin-like peptidyl-prolyl isomerase